MTEQQQATADMCIGLMRKNRITIADYVHYGVSDLCETEAYDTETKKVIFKKLSEKIQEFAESINSK
ncbi:MAG: hypothetical protein GY750_20795 [Lentisphaerae bacterium]|nr:hypothetical protein [Lentisphaerota bacterium]